MCVHLLNFERLVLTRCLFAQLQDKKRKLAEAALSGDEIKNMKLSMDELLALFRPRGRNGDSDFRN